MFMSLDLRPVTPENLESVVDLINGSSRGLNFQFELNVFKFLTLSRFWNFSYSHSYVGYLGGEPAGVLLNVADAPEREAFSFYWGVLPKFRNRRLSMALVDAYFDQLRREGYHRTHADVTSQSPLGIYEKLGYKKNQELIELKAQKPSVEAGNNEFQICFLEPRELLSQWTSFHAGFSYWTRRPSFIRNAAPFLEIVGAYQQDRLQAYAVITCWPGHTSIVDLQFSVPAKSAAHQLIHSLLRNQYPLPFVVSFVPSASPVHAMLGECGFTLAQRFTSMTLEFSTHR